MPVISKTSKSFFHTFFAFFAFFENLRQKKGTPLFPFSPIPQKAE